MKECVRCEKAISDKQHKENAALCVDCYRLLTFEKDWC